MTKRRINRLSKSATTYRRPVSMRDGVVFGALTIIPLTLIIQHPTIRLAYRMRPLRMYGHPTLATRAGKILQNAMTPFGVDGGTRSSAAATKATALSNILVGAMEHWREELARSGTKK